MTGEHPRSDAIQARHDHLHHRPPAGPRPGQRTGHRTAQRARSSTTRGVIPWPLGVPALVGALFLLVPLAGLLVRAGDGNRTRTVSLGNG